jgi:oxygen-independent coproporphyrinogen III oxidase
LIEALLCRGTARLEPDLAAEAEPRLAPFVLRGLAELGSGQLTITPGGLPYARTIAALFDPYRQDSLRRFSSAV